MSTYSYSKCQNLVLSIRVFDEIKNPETNKIDKKPIDLKICINPIYITDRLGSRYDSTKEGLNNISSCVINHVYARKLDFTERYAVITFFDDGVQDIFKKACGYRLSYEPHNDKLITFFDNIGFDKNDTSDLNIIQINEDPINFLMKNLYVFK